MSAEHYGALRLAEIDASEDGRWRFGVSMPSPEEYPQVLWGGVLSQYLVCSAGGEMVHGVVCAYDHDPISRIVSIAVTKFGDRTAPNPLMKGAAHFVDRLFQSCDLRKIRIETPEWNLDRLGGLLRHGIAVEEGRLRNERFARGRYWDVVLLAIWRDDWTRVRGAILG